MNCIFWDTFKLNLLSTGRRKPNTVLLVALQEKAPTAFLYDDHLCATVILAVLKGLITLTAPSCIDENVCVCTYALFEFVLFITLDFVDPGLEIITSSVYVDVAFSISKCFIRSSPMSDCSLTYTPFLFDVIGLYSTYWHSAKVDWWNLPWVMFFSSMPYICIALQIMLRQLNSAKATILIDQWKR